MLCMPVFICTSGSSALLAHVVAYLTVATCHIQYTFLFLSRENGQKHKNTRSHTKMAADSYKARKTLILRAPLTLLPLLSCESLDYLNVFLEPVDQVVNADAVVRSGTCSQRVLNCLHSKIQLVH